MLKNVINYSHQSVNICVRRSDNDIIVNTLTIKKSSQKITMLIKIMSIKPLLQENAA